MTTGLQPVLQLMRFASLKGWKVFFCTKRIQEYLP
jgi:hypothetical protein